MRARPSNAARAATAILAFLSVAFLRVASAQPEAAAGNRGVIMPRDTRPEPPPPPPEKRPARQERARERIETAQPRELPRSAWKLLNEYFGSKLENPTPDEMLGTLVARLNRQTLNGVPPSEEWRQFDAWLKQARRSMPRGETDTALVEGFYRNLVEWVELEGAFRLKKDRNALQRLAEVVTRQAQLDPGLDAVRRDRILATIERQRLFVPSGILFGFSVLPYRDMKLPEGHSLHEVLIAPQFEDRAHAASATYDFIAPLGPVCRIDFDSIESRLVRVEASSDAKNFELVEERKSTDPEGVVGPLLLSPGWRARAIRITAESDRESAVLRNVRVFAMKEPPAVISIPTDHPMQLDGLFKEPPWPFEAPVDGFVELEQRGFAEAQTTVRLCHSDDTLFVGVYAREPRMNTLHANMTAHDAPLWEEESVELLIQPPGAPPHRFIVNALGARFDSRAGDAAWNGEWAVATKTFREGWSAEFAVPFATLGARPSPAEDWRFDAIRSRRNVKNERSRWAYTDESNDKSLAPLIFESIANPRH